MQNDVEVVLLSPTTDQLRTVMESVNTAWDYAKTNDSISEILMRSHETDPITRFVEIMNQRLPLTWFQNFIWAIGGVSRAFMDQLDRHQMPKYWEQSFRVLDLKTFADRGAYWHPEWLNGSSGDSHRLDNHSLEQIAKMLNNGEFDENSHQDKKAVVEYSYDRIFTLMQDLYKGFVRLGMPSEQARGIMGLHVNTRTTMVCSWDALRHMVSARTCFIAQGEYWRPVIAGMVSELHRIGFPEDLIKALVKTPCIQTGSCPYEGNMLERLKDDPNDVCPLWIDDYMGEKFVYDRTVSNADMFHAGASHSDRYRKVQKDLIDFSVKKNPNYKDVTQQYGQSVGRDLVQILGL